jgi:hypothetical protein
VGVRLSAIERQRSLQSWISKQAISSEHECAEVLAREHIVPTDMSFSTTTLSGAQWLGRFEAASGGSSAAHASALARRSRNGFAYGGVSPGPKARGQVLESHEVHFSVDTASTFWLHISLRSQTAPVLGSPFLLTVKPGPAHPLLTQVQQPLVGHSTGLPPEHAEQLRTAASQAAGRAKQRHEDEKERERLAALAKQPRRPYVAAETNEMHENTSEAAAAAAAAAREAEARAAEEALVRKSKAEKAAALAEKAAADLARAQWFSCTSELIVRDRMGSDVQPAPVPKGGAGSPDGDADLIERPIERRPEHSVEDLGNGSYVLKWGASAAGCYQVFVKLDGMHVLGSPAILKLEL